MNTASNVIEVTEYNQTGSQSFTVETDDTKAIRALATVKNPVSAGST